MKGLRKKIPPDNGHLKHTLPEHVTTDTYFPNAPRNKRENERQRNSRDSDVFPRAL